MLEFLDLVFSFRSDEKRSNEEFSSPAPPS